MIASATHHFVYVHMYKCGGTSVEVSLNPALGWKDLLIGSTHEGEDIQWKAVQRLHLNKHSTLADIHRVVGPDDWATMRTFATVRDPFEICESWYRFAATTVSARKDSPEAWAMWDADDSWPYGWPYSASIIRHYCRSVLADTGFAGFLMQALLGDDQRLRPQVRSLSLGEPQPGLPDMDLLIDVAELDARWEELCAYLGVTPTPELKRANVSRHHDLTWTSELVAAVESHFAADFALIPPRSGSVWNAPVAAN